MSNLRVLYKNEIDSASLSGGITPASLPHSNLATDIKSQIFRSSTTVAEIAALWATPKFINCVMLPFTNFSSTATIRVMGYANAADTTAVFDSGVLPCCGYASRNTVPGVANFGYAGGAYASLFFVGGTVKRIVVYVSDSNNPAGYVEASRLLVGKYFEPVINADYGASIGWNDDSQHVRNDAGDLLTDIKTRSKTLTLNFSNASPSDRDALMAVMRNGIGSPLYISVFPNDADKNLEQDYQIWGKLSQQSAIIIARYSAYSTGLTIDEV
ncbi:hypothetical protein [Methylobacter sp. S3L5C]|uniref:hypothetical protein n=1 Tax=Methylobacter sp. S3L5C TaxID=2839024 RepID=UPI001FAD0C34|nr:hypothetical protein [Methylobacter sp. S3L5C]UOA07768.1 hypothetical protein KKZ03_16145 [Methylobacter sp. S3L5C]